jgi:membrane glycosyltransferase
MATKMRQSLNQFERAFLEETQADRVRREALRRQAVQRARQRQVQRVHKHGSARFWVLVLVLLATAVLVTIAMFETLYYVMG